MLYPVKIEFKDYPSGSWQDWSEYLTHPPSINKKIESENEGEAGLIVFDDADVSFRYEDDVYDAFSIDLTSKQRYLFRISAAKKDGSFVQLFEGIADFSTLKWDQYVQEVSFTIVDKLSALNLLQGELTRVMNTLDARVKAQYATADGLEFRVDTGHTDEIWIKPAFGDTGSYYLNFFVTTILKVGEIFRDPTAMYLTIPSTLTYGLVTESWIDDGWNKIKYINADGFDYTTWFVELGHYRYPVWFGSNYNIEFGEKEIYDVDILNYEDGVPVSINGLSFIEVLIGKAWSGINFIYRGITDYNIPLSYYIMFLDENPLGKTPLDALKMIADSMKCYIYFDKTGSNLIIQAKSDIDSGGTSRSIGTTRVISGPERNYFWDKLVDGVTINVKSWAVDEETGENLVGVAELTKQATGFSALQKIKPKNSITRDLLVGDPAVDTQEELDTYAADEALSMLNFYGKRHQSFTLNLNLDDNTINWELVDRLIINSIITFFTKMNIDLVRRIVSFDCIEIEGHDYDFRQLVFGSADSSGVSTGYSSSGGGYLGGGSMPIFNVPLQLSGGIVSLLYDPANLKLTADKLNTIQDIHTGASPTFNNPTVNQLTLNNAGTGTSNAVRADRTLQIITTAPLSGGGAAINLTADRSWTLSITASNLLGTVNRITVTNGTGAILGSSNVTLNLPQDIHTTASPTFDQLTLNNAGTGTSNAVRADRSITTTSPLTGGGNLTADRTLSLSYNTTNLKLTSNELNTIQDINTSASPTFATAKLTNLTDKYIPFHQSDSDGLVDTNIKFDNEKVGVGIPKIGLFSLPELLNVNGNTKQWGDIYSNNFANTDPIQGYYIGRSGSVFNKITVGELHAVAFIADLEQALAGGQIIAKSVAKLAVDFEVTDSEPVSSLIVESFAGYETMAVFANGDTIRLRNFARDGGGLTITDAWGIVTLDTSYGASGFNTTLKTQAYVFTKVGGSNFTAKAGIIVLDYGAIGNGIIETIAVGAVSGKPYSQVAEWVSGTVPVMSIRERHGHLGGITSVNFGALNGYGFYGKGGVYLEGGSTNSIAFKSTDSAATLTMKQGSDVIFNFDTGTATAKISGFNFNKKYLWNLGSGTPTSSPLGGVVIGADATDAEVVIYGSNAGEKVRMWADISEWGIKGTVNAKDYFELGSTNKISGNTFDDNYIWKLGSGTPGSSPAKGYVIASNSNAITFYGGASTKYVRMYYTSDTDWGLIGKADNADTVFQLGYINQIAGWSFEKEKFYKTDTRLESSASFKGLAVSSGGVDVVKVGDFTSANETYYTDDISNPPNPAIGWIVENNTHGNLQWTTGGAILGSNGGVTDFTKYQLLTYLVLPSADVKGKTIKISFDIAEQENGIYGYVEKLEPIWVYVVVDGVKIGLKNIAPTGIVTTIGNPISWESKSLVVNIPANATSVKFYIEYNVDNNNFEPANVLFQNWDFEYYTRSLVELNKQGLNIYSSPISRILLNVNKAEFNMPTVKASDSLMVGNWEFTIEPYLEGDGVTMNERLRLKYKGVNKGWFSQLNGNYYTT